MAEDRPHDVSGMTDDELMRARRDLMVSLTLSPRASPMHTPILAHVSAIDAELARRGNPDAPSSRS
jgi:hypothetical protein